MLKRVLFLALVAGVFGNTLGDLLEDARELPGYDRRKKVKTFRAYVTHGVNAYNGKKIFNFSEVSNIFSEIPPMEDIGVWNPAPNATNASQITSETPKDADIASMFPAAFHSIMGAGNPDPVGPFNVPIFETPTFTPKSTDITDRKTPASFKDSDSVANQGNYAAYRKTGTHLTLKEYNSAAGWMKIVCKDDGTGAYKMRIRGIPLGLYTAWDIIIKKALTNEEDLMVGPFGGAPNVIATDKFGLGEMERKLNFCPLEKCKGSERCSVGVIMLYHFDHMVYGSAPELAVQGYGPGNAASHHLMFLINGKPLTKRKH